MSSKDCVDLVKKMLYIHTQTAFYIESALSFYLPRPEQNFSLFWNGPNSYFLILWQHAAVIPENLAWKQPDKKLSSSKHTPQFLSSGKSFYGWHVITRKWAYCKKTIWFHNKVEWKLRLATYCCWNSKIIQKLMTLSIAIRTIRLVELRSSLDVLKKLQEARLPPIVTPTDAWQRNISGRSNYTGISHFTTSTNQFHYSNKDSVYC